MMPRPPSDVPIGAASASPSASSSWPGAGRGGARRRRRSRSRFARAQLRGRALDLVVGRRRPIRRHGQLKRRIGTDRFARPCPVSTTFAERPYRSRCAGRGEPVMASRQAWRSRRGRSAASVDIGGELGHRREQRPMREFLIGVAVMVERRLAPGQRDHRAAAEIRVLQSCGEVCRADRLREADARAGRRCARSHRPCRRRTSPHGPARA